jgi:hypothetical protein
MSDIDAYEINRRLINVYGRAVDRDLPNFRVVRSETQIEKRKSQVTEEGIQLPFGSVIREIPKYPWLPDCWVLEVYCPSINEMLRDAVDAPYSYEPILPMINPENEPLPLAWRAIEFAVNSWIKAKDNFNRKTQEDIDKEEAAETKKKEEALFDELGGKYNVADALHYGDGVFIKSKDVGDKVERTDSSNGSVDVPLSSDSGKAGIIP